MVGKSLMRTPPLVNPENIRTRSSSKSEGDKVITNNININTESVPIPSKNIIVIDDSDSASNDINKCTLENECVYGITANEVNVAKCNNCVNLQSELKEVRKIISTTLLKNEEILNKLDILTTIVNNFTKTSVSVDNISSVATKPTFFEVVKPMPKITPVVVMKPRNTSQTQKETVKEVNLKLDPKCANINNIRGASNGGLIVECSSAAESQKFKKLAEKELGNNYNISIPAAKTPMLRIIGITSFHEDEALITMIRDHNEEVFNADSNIKILQRYRFSRSDTYGVKISVDAESFAKCMDLMRLRILFDMCKVYEAFGIIRCFQCNDFNHVVANCTSQVSCAKCSRNHRTTDCKSSEIKCINCIKAVESLKIDIDISHVAWSDNCHVYQEKVKIDKRRINYDPVQPPL